MRQQLTFSRGLTLIIMNQQSYYTTNTTNISCHPPRSFSSIKTKVGKAQYHASDSFHGVPHKLPSLIEIRRHRSKTPLSSSTFQNIMKCLRFCFVATISTLSNYLFCGSRFNAIERQLKVVHSVEKDDSKLHQAVHDDDDDHHDQDHDEHSHKHVFRQEMKPSTCAICHRNCKNRCGDSSIRSSDGYRIDHRYRGNTANTYSTSTIRRYRKQHYRLANQLIQEHFVHANYLNRQSHPITLCNK